MLILELLASNIYCRFKKGPCPAVCGKLKLGMFSGFGNVRASNRGEEIFLLAHFIFCIHFIPCQGIAFKIIFPAAIRQEKWGLR